MQTAIFQTVFAGVAVFVLGQIVLKLVIDPVQQLKRTIGEVSFALAFYANVYTNPGIPKPELMDEASTKLRQLACQVAADLRVIPLYRHVRLLFALPSYENILSAQASLIGLSNGVFGTIHNGLAVNITKSQTVADALGIRIPPNERVPDDLLKKMMEHSE